MLVLAQLILLFNIALCDRVVVDEYSLPVFYTATVTLDDGKGPVAKFDEEYCEKCLEFTTKYEKKTIYVHLGLNQDQAFVIENSKCSVARAPHSLKKMINGNLQYTNLDISKIKIGNENGVCLSTTSVIGWQACFYEKKMKFESQQKFVPYKVKFQSNTYTIKTISYEHHHQEGHEGFGLPDTISCQGLKFTYFEYKNMMNIHTVRYRQIKSLSNFPESFSQMKTNLKNEIYFQQNLNNMDTLIIDALSGVQYRANTDSGVCLLDGYDSEQFKYIRKPARKLVNFYVGFFFGFPYGFAHLGTTFLTYLGKKTKYERYVSKEQKSFIYSGVAYQNAVVNLYFMKDQSGKTQPVPAQMTIYHDMDAGKNHTYFKFHNDFSAVEEEINPQDLLFNFNPSNCHKADDKVVVEIELEKSLEVKSYPEILNGIRNSLLEAVRVGGVTNLANMRLSDLKLLETLKNVKIIFNLFERMEPYYKFETLSGYRMKPEQVIKTAFALDARECARICYEDSVCHTFMIAKDNVCSLSNTALLKTELIEEKQANLHIVGIIAIDNMRREGTIDQILAFLKEQKSILITINEQPINHKVIAVNKEVFNDNFDSVVYFKNMWRRSDKKLIKAADIGEQTDLYGCAALAFTYMASTKVDGIAFDSAGKTCQIGRLTNDTLSNDDEGPERVVYEKNTSGMFQKSPDTYSESQFTKNPSLKMNSCGNPQDGMDITLTATNPPSMSFYYCGDSNNCYFSTDHHWISPNNEESENAKSTCVGYRYTDKIVFDPQMAFDGLEKSYIELLEETAIDKATSDCLSKLTSCGGYLLCGDQSHPSVATSAYLVPANNTDLYDQPLKGGFYCQLHTRRFIRPPTETRTISHISSKLEGLTKGGIAGLCIGFLFIGALLAAIVKFFIK